MDVGQSEHLMAKSSGYGEESISSMAGKHPIGISAEFIHSVGCGQDSLSEPQLPPKTSFSHPF